MITLDQLTYDLLRIVRGGAEVDDDTLSLRQIEFWIKNTRAKLIYQDIRKNRRIPEDVRQRLHCVPVQQVDLSRACGIKTNCFAYRTVRQLPTPLESGYSEYITYAGPANILDKDFKILNKYRVKWELDNKFEKNIPKAFYYDGYMYVVDGDNPNLKYIDIEMVAEDPMDLAAFRSCNDEECFSPKTSPYPITARMVEDMKALILRADLSVMLGLPMDTKGDARNSLNPVKMPNAPQQQEEDNG